MGWNSNIFKYAFDCPPYPVLMHLPADLALKSKKRKLLPVAHTTIIAVSPRIKPFAQLAIMQSGYPHLRG
jgi:hypothetical protein